MSGQAASYYDPGQGFDAQAQPAPYEKRNENYSNGYNGYDQRNDGIYQPPVNYQQPANYQQPGAETKPQQPPYPDNPPPYSTFDDAFKIEKPKYNDIWAGLLVSCRNTVRSEEWDRCFRDVLENMSSQYESEILPESVRPNEATMPS